MLSRWLRSSRYARLSNREETSADENDWKKSDSIWSQRLHGEHTSDLQLSFRAFVSILVAVILVASVVGFGIGAIVFRSQTPHRQALNIAPRGDSLVPRLIIYF